MKRKIIYFLCILSVLLIIGGIFLSFNKKEEKNKKKDTIVEKQIDDVIIDSYECINETDNAEDGYHIIKKFTFIYQIKNNNFEITNGTLSFNYIFNSFDSFAKDTIDPMVGMKANDSSVDNNTLTKMYSYGIVLKGNRTSLESYISDIEKDGYKCVKDN